jgi:hypothetical protein
VTDQTGAIWRKSACSNNGGNCVEVATNLHTATGRVLVRDTKDRGAGPVLGFAVDEWRAFLAGVRDGEFDA